jgi:predicted enzyme related to lactoylglutathione lyase
MNRVTHFEISADDPERASEFYSKVFGWNIQKWEGPVDYWLVTTGEEGDPGIDGALQRRPEPPVGTINTIGVSSIDEYMEKVTANGGKVVKDKVVIPGIGSHAYCEDTEGNVFGIFEGAPPEE